MYVKLINFKSTFRMLRKSNYAFKKRTCPLSELYPKGYITYFSGTFSPQLLSIFTANISYVWARPLADGGQFRRQWNCIKGIGGTQTPSPLFFHDLKNFPSLPRPKDPVEFNPGDPRDIPLFTRILFLTHSRGICIRKVERSPFFFGVPLPFPASHFF